MFQNMFISCKYEMNMTGHISTLNHGSIEEASIQPAGHKWFTNVLQLFVIQVVTSWVLKLAFSF